MFCYIFNNFYIIHEKDLQCSQNFFFHKNIINIVGKIKCSQNFFFQKNIIIYL